MDDLDKVRVLIPHWIEHNREHGREFEKWAALLQEAGRHDIAGLLRQAVSGLRTAEVFLQQALHGCGGTVGGNQHGNHHHHH